MADSCFGRAIKSASMPCTKKPHAVSDGSLANAGNMASARSGCEVSMRAVSEVFCCSAIRSVPAPCCASRFTSSVPCAASRPRSNMSSNPAVMASRTSWSCPMIPPTNMGTLALLFFKKSRHGSGRASTWRSDAYVSRVRPRVRYGSAASRAPPSLAHTRRTAAAPNAGASAHLLKSDPR